MSNTSVITSHMLVMGVADSQVAEKIGEAIHPIPQVDTIDDDNQTWWAVFEIAQYDAGTVDAYVEGSWDGNVWHQLSVMNQLAAPGIRTEINPLQVILPYMRMHIVGAGGATATGLVRLASNKPWRNDVYGVNL